MSSVKRGHKTYGNVGKEKSKGPTVPIVQMLLIICGLVLLGVFFCATMAPSELENGPSTNSILDGSKKRFETPRTLSQKILGWLPRGHAQTGSHGEEEDLQGPDWSQEFWSPTDLDVSHDPVVTLCKLNFQEYSENPHLYPMFRDLEGSSNCMGSNRKREKLSVLLKEIADMAGTPGGRVIAPTGFVFHESRVGSTLVANALASDPFSMVFSESAPAANALLHCDTCTRERNVQLFRDVVTLMGRSPIHKRLFFKFQSITSTKMEIALEAFPDTPFAFVYRQPVQTMMSHLDPLKGSSGAPCLRSMRSPPEEVRLTISKVAGSSGPPKEAWCAAHLNMLCNSALHAYEKFGVVTDAQGNIRQRGMMINYESLPGIVGRAMLPMFAVQPSKTWLAKMSVECKFYSKGRGKVGIFLGDSKDKDERATDLIQKYGEEILGPTYDKLAAISEESLKAVAPKEYALVVSQGGAADKNWKALSEVPEESQTPAAHLLGAGGDAVQGGSVLAMVSGDKLKDVPIPVASHLRGHRGHSSALPQKDFVAWAPFSNTHSSVSIEPPRCPPIPEEGYPKAFSMIDITNNWNTDVTEIPPLHYDTLCHFDYSNQTELDYALAYRKAEVPFVAYNIPEVDKVVKKWNDIDYLQKRLGKKSYRTETSKDNHFMYWRGGASATERDGKKWKAPTGLASVTFEDWMELAVKGQNKSLESRTHQYFRVSSDMGNEWLFDELPFFHPEPSLMIVDPREQRGIHCRFGMRSVIAEAHFDGSRNAVVMLGGLRRWILAHPNQCVNMHMLPSQHPSGRHSEVDWSKPDLATFPNFAKIVGNEVILRPGDFLYVPTYWIHYIVSLNVNFQCNTRSGRSEGFNNDIKRCGF